MNPYKPPKAKRKYKQPIVDWEGLLFVVAVLAMFFLLLAGAQVLK